MTRPIEKIQLRAAILGIITLIVFIVILSRLWFLQVLAGEKYAELADNNRIKVIFTNAPRGIIYDRNGNVLVGNRPGISVTVTPLAIKGKETRVLSRLSDVLGVEVEAIKNDLEKKGGDPLRPVIIQRDVSKEVVAYLKEHEVDFPGVDIEIEAVRDYLPVGRHGPYTNLAAHVVGYLGEISEEELLKEEYENYTLGAIIGKTGLEKQYEHLLRGIKGEKRIEVNAGGRPLKVLEEKEAVPGYNLKLTIDTNIQITTEEALFEAIKIAHSQGYENAAAGSAVVMDARNGEIYALASYPTYDPAAFVRGISATEWKKLNEKSSNFPLINRVVSCSYAPGSTFKPFTAIAGLSEGKISPSTTFFCTGKWTEMGERWPKYCWKRSGHGRVDLVRSIVDSCDTVFYEIGYKFYKDKSEGLQNWARQFGFGSPTGIDLPSEKSGRVPDKAWKESYFRKDPKSQIWLPGDNVNLAIGQGDLLVTPLQLATAYSAIANGGSIPRPHLVKGVWNYNENIERQLKTDKKVIEIPFSVLKRVKEGLEGVVGEGTAKYAFSGFPLSVSGKTGTAEVKGKDDFAWFACYAPFDNPRYVVVVMVEQGGHGGSCAAPAARKILSRIFKIDGAPPKFVTDVSR